MIDSALRLPKTRVTRESGSRPRAEPMSESTGVIPEPAAKATWWRASSGRAGQVKVPRGGITSSSSPTSSCSVRYVDIRPPGTWATATRSVGTTSPSRGTAQIE
jgi:hypothetical protein